MHYLIQNPTYNASSNLLLKYFQIVQEFSIARPPTWLKEHGSIMKVSGPIEGNVVEPMKDIGHRSQFHPHTRDRPTLQAEGRAMHNQGCE